MDRLKKLKRQVSYLKWLLSLYDRDKKYSPYPDKVLECIFRGLDEMEENVKELEKIQNYTNSAKMNK